MPLATDGMYKTEPVYQKLKSASVKYGVPTWIISSIVEHESGFNPKAHGDVGLGASGSWGLFQLYTGNGLGKGKTPAQLQDIDTNIAIAMPHLKEGYRKAQAKGLTGYALLKETAATSGWPLQTGSANMPSSYDKGLQKAFYNGDELAGLGGQQVRNVPLKYPQADPSIWLTGKTDNVNRELLGRLANLGKKYNTKINIISGYRSTAEQKRLYDGYKAGLPGFNLAAPPGTSNHEKSPAEAVDIQSPKFQGMSEKEFKACGLHRPVGGENWHVELFDRDNKGSSFNTNELREVVRSSYDMMKIEELSQGSYSLFRQIDNLSKTNGELNGDLTDGFGVHRFVEGSGKAIAFRLFLALIGLSIVFAGIMKANSLGVFK